jgi:hypothetical protein
MGRDFDSFYTAVVQQVLNDANIGTLFEQVRGSELLDWPRKL